VRNLSNIEAAILCGGFLVAAPVVGAAQGVVIPGVTGTIALEGTVNQEHAVANVITVKTVDGARHVFLFTKDLLVHGGKGAGVDALRGLQDGTKVVVHYTAAGGIESAQEVDQIGGEGLRVTEGVAIRVDRGRRQLIVRFADGTRETFELTERAAADVGKEIDQAGADTAKVVVYYSDEKGQKVAHYFRKVS
jgi:hypothetical protein